MNGREKERLGVVRVVEETKELWRMGEDDEYF